MLSSASRAAAGMRRLPIGARLLSAKAPLVKSLAAEQKALSDAVAALGDNASYDKVKALVEAEPYKSTMAKVKGDDLSWTWSMLDSSPSKPPVTVAVSGAGSDVGAAALFRIAAGEMLGLDQPVALQLLGAKPEVVKDLEACGFPLLKSVTAANDAGAAFKGATYALLLEGDFAAQGKAIAAGAKGALVAVAGNTNALVASKAAGEAASVTSITRGAQLSAELALASSSGVSPLAVENVSPAPLLRPQPLLPTPSACEHSPPHPYTLLYEQVISWGDGIADISHATVGGKWALKVSDAALPEVGEPSVATAADAAVMHIKDWALGSDGKWVSMGVPAVGDYGMGEGFFYSVPVVCTPGDYKRVGGVTMTAEVAGALEASRSALAADAAKL
jgi:malate dehydrogenase